MALLDFLTGGNKADGDSNGSLFTRLKDAAGGFIGKKHREAFTEDSEALVIAGKNDDVAMAVRTDRKGNLIIGNHIPEFSGFFEGATIHAQKWTATNTTFVPAQTTIGGYNFNSTNLTTASAVAILQTQRLFYRMQRTPMQIKQRLRHAMVTNGIADFGWGVPSGTTLIVPNGTCIRLLNSGQLVGVITYNSVEIAVGNIISRVASNGNTIGGNLNMSNAFYTANYFVYDVIIDDDNAVFTVQDTGTGEIIGALSLLVPNNIQKMWGSTGLPVYNRVYNNGAPASSSTYILTDIQVLSTDTNLNLDGSQLAGNLGMSAGRNPFTGVQLENHTNSAAPSSATLSNTAAGYTTLGGKFQFAAVAGAATDFALFGFTVPAGSRFLCEGIKISTMNTGAAVATTASTLEWAMGFNSSAVSLATANIIRRQIGMQSFPVGAAIGAVAADIDIDFKTPEVVESARFLHVILTLNVGTATASQVIRGQVLIKGRFI